VGLLHTILRDLLIGFVLLVAGRVGWVVWVHNVRRYPWRPCWWCLGSAKKPNPIGERTYGDCWWCGGSGKQRRIGAVLLGLPRPSTKGRHGKARRR